MPFSSSVLIPSLRRPESLKKCLLSLAQQSVLPDEVIVVWQTDDISTKVCVEEIQNQLPYFLKMLHSPEANIVLAENCALQASRGEIIFLMDDDAIAPPRWLERHLSFYQNLKVGAVGGPANNFDLQGMPYPKRSVNPVGKLSWYGKLSGNMYDHVENWKNSPVSEVDHLVGYNMSLRRIAFQQFNLNLKPYWQNFELDVCLQVKQKGFQVLFDYGNQVSHFPTNPAFNGNRDIQKEIRIYNPAYNYAFILASRSPFYLKPIRLFYLLLVGNVSAPGFLAYWVAMFRFKKPIRETQILLGTLKAKLQGWWDGRR